MLTQFKFRMLEENLWTEQIKKGGEDFEELQPEDFSSSLMLVSYMS